MAESREPAFVFVPGTCCPGRYFDKVAESLEAQGHTTVSIDLPTIRPDQEPPSFSLNNDCDYVRGNVVELLDAGKDVVLVGNSYGGWVVFDARKSSIIAAQRSGASGGTLKQIVLIVSILAPQTKQLTVGELLGFKGMGEIDFEDPKAPVYYDPPPAAFFLKMLFDSLPEDEKETYGTMAGSQRRSIMTVPMTCAVYEEVPTSLVICKNDKTLKIQQQEDSFDEAVKRGVEGLRKIYLEADYVAMLSHLQEVIKVLREAAGVTKPDETTG